MIAVLSVSIIALAARMPEPCLEAAA